LLLSKYLFALNQDTIKIKAVEIFDQNKSNQIQNTNHKSLSNLLRNESPVFIKDYGPGMLSTITQRGLGANHTNLLWEGINIQNPMLGLNDLSIIPIHAFSSIYILSGNSSYINSNGAFGGSINMQSAIPQEFKINLNTSYNFYQNLNSSFGIEDNKKRFWYRYNLFNTNAPNQYNYINNITGTNIMEKQNYAAMQLTGQIIEIGTFLNPYLSISIKNWIQISKREIPSPVGINNNSEKQKDLNNRTIVKVNYTKNKISFINTFAVLNDSINYYNPKASGNADTSLSYSKSYKNNLNLFYNLSNYITIKGGLQSEINNGKTINYVNPDNKSSQHYIYIIPILHYKFLKIAPTYKAAYYSISNQFYNIYNIHSEFNAYNKLFISVNHGQNYRFPTLNDLYWLPGGNPSLKPEKGNLNDLIFLLSPFINKNNYLKYTVYNNTINNYIVWLPGSAGYFTPQNLKQIWSRGFELESNIELNRNSYRLTNKSVYAYTKSTNKKSNLINDESIGRQLLYTPIYNVKNILSISYKDIGLFNEYTFVSWRAVSTDNYDYLPWYQIFNIGVYGEFKIKRNLFRISGAINNLFNQNYEVIKNRPMPLRNYSVSLSYQFNK
jgi:iron complex outermembrane receptor protein